MHLGKLNSLADLNKYEFDGDQDTTIDAENLPADSVEIELTETVDKITELKTKLGIVDFVQTKYTETFDKLDISYEKEKTDKSPEQIMVGYLEGSKALNDFKDNREFLDNDELELLLSIDESNTDATNRNYYLMQIHEKILQRKRDNLRPNAPATQQSFTDIKHNLKTNYVMDLNGMVTDYIDSATKSDNHASALYDTLRKVYAYSIDPIVDLTDNLPILERYFSNAITRKNNLEGLYSLATGMRHEEGFKELMYEMDATTDPMLFDVVETDDDDDSHGIDLILNVRLSKKLLPDGSFQLASDKELDSGDVIEKPLPIDIKSTKKAAMTARESQKNQYNIGHWVMWSHIYNQDFRLSYDEDEGSQMNYTADEAPIYLKYDEQIEAMKNLGRVRYFDPENGGTFLPETLDERTKMIKSDVLQGINAIYGKNTQSVGNSSVA